MYKNENAQLFSILKRLNKDKYLNHYLYQKKTTATNICRHRKNKE